MSYATYRTYGIFLIVDGEKGLVRRINPIGTASRNRETITTRDYKVCLRHIGAIKVHLNCPEKVVT